MEGGWRAAANSWVEGRRAAPGERVKGRGAPMEGSRQRGAEGDVMDKIRLRKKKERENEDDMWGHR